MPITESSSVALAIKKDIIADKKQYSLNNLLNKLNLEEILRSKLKKYFIELRFPNYAAEFRLEDRCDLFEYHSDDYYIIRYTRTYFDSSNPDLEKTESENDIIFQFFLKKFGKIDYDSDYDYPITLIENELLLLECELYAP